MDITWNGKTSFTFKGKEATIVVNPKSDKEKGDIVLNSEENGTELKDATTFDWPGEYEIKGVPIVASKVGDTLVFYFELDGIRICHLGTIADNLPGEIVKEIGDIDILLIDGTKDGALGPKKADEVLEEIDPRAMIPMGEGSFAEFLKEIGADQAESLDKFSIKNSSELPDDKRLYIFLNQS